MQKLLAYLRTTPWPLLAMAAALGVLDLLLTPVMEGMRWPNYSQIGVLCFFSGLIASQFAMVSIWWAFSRGEVLWRTAILFVLLLALIALCFLGIVVTISSGEVFSPRRREVLGFILVHVFFGWAAAALPLWSMRKALGWGVLPVVSQEDRGFTRQISIRDIMVATFVVAILSSLVTQYTRRDGYVLYSLLSYIVFVTTISTLVLLPVVRWMLYDACHQTGLAWSIGYLGVIPFLSALVFMLCAGSFGSGSFYFDPEVFFLYLVLCHSFAGSVLVSLYICRELGFRLVTVWDKLPGDEIIYLSTGVKTPVTKTPLISEPDMHFMEEE